MKFLDDSISLSGKRVLLRVDFNVSVLNKSVKEPFRILKSLPTISFLLGKGAKVILLSHIDEKEGGTLEPVARFLLPTFPKLRFLPDIYSENTKEEILSLKEGEICLLENLRLWKGEEANDLKFSEFIASFGDIFVQDAFSVCHRNHATVVSLPKLLPSYGGFILKDEIKNLSKVFDPEHPFLFILGGAKFETKIPLIEKFEKMADSLFVAGALSNDLFKAKGFFVGESLVSDKNLDLREYLENPKIHIPLDIVTVSKGITYIKSPEEVSVGEKIVDIGPKTIDFLKDEIQKASFVVWNGPLGKNESGFDSPTLEIAKAIATSGASTIVGGGDTLSAIHKLNIFDKFGFVSTGGGSMLEFLVNETLPGIEALDFFTKSKNFKDKKTFWSKIFG